MTLYNFRFTHQPRTVSAVKPFADKFLTLLLCTGLPLSAIADDKGGLPSVTLDYQGVSSSLGGAIQLAPFKYIPPAGVVNKVTKPGIDLPKRSPDQQQLFELAAAGDYRTVGTQGLTLPLLFH